ncbi:MAG: glycosyltransferase family 4 protein [Rhodobacterales bacterium]|nr:glycosyltransferase family 4 protein [Rhodobacterales bacterium]
MKILFLTENFPPETNAAATRVYERACYWVRWGHQVTVITCAPNFPHGRLFDGYENAWCRTEEMAGIRVVRMKTYIAANRGVAKRGLDFLSFGATGLWGALRQEKPDVIAATSPQFFAAVAGWLAGAWRRVPFVFELGDLWPASIAAVGAVRQGLALHLLEALELHMYRRAACVVALTHAFKDNLTARGIDPAKVAVVRNGVDLPRYGPRDRDPVLAAQWGLEDAFVVGYVGTHGMAHGLMNVLDAAQRLADRPRLKFLLAGAGAERDLLVAEAARRGLTNVIFMPPQPKEAMPQVWSLCDVALVHLKDDPVFAGVIPSKIFEAMGMGLPLLMAAPEGEATAIVRDSGAGVVVPAGDPAALADAVAGLMDDPNRLSDLATDSLAAAPDYSRETQARLMLAALELAAAGQGHRAGLAPAEAAP